MRALRVIRAGMLAGVSIGTLAACTPNPPLEPGYVICDDTQNASACPNTTAPVVVDNSL